MNSESNNVIESKNENQKSSISSNSTEEQEQLPQDMESNKYLATVLDSFEPGSENPIFNRLEVCKPKGTPLSESGYFRRWRFIPEAKSGISSVEYGDRTDGLKIKLDVSQFDDKNVVVRPYLNHIAVEAKQLEQRIPSTTSSVKRAMARLYKVPPDIDLDTLSYTVQNGIVEIQASKKVEEPTEPQDEK